LMISVPQNPMKEEEEKGRKGVNASRRYKTNSNIRAAGPWQCQRPTEQLLDLSGLSGYSRGG
jgi:hypothetical protein